MIGTPSPTPTPRAAAATPFRAPTPGHPIDLRLDANEGLAPPIDLVQIMASFGREGVRRYPSARALEEALAARHGVDPARVIVTAGGDEAIDRVCRAFLEPGRDLILPSPTFEMIPRYAALAGATIRSVRWRDGPYPIEGVLSHVAPRTALIAVVSPNNPTGAVAHPDDLRRLAVAAPRALILLDAAYAEFADVDLTPTALTLPNVLSVRTFSKAFGLAGLRVGYAIGEASVVATLRAVGGPFSVSSLSAAIAGAALDSAPAWMPEVLARVAKERRALAGLLRSLGAHATDSHANFILAEHPHAELIRDRLAAGGIGIRLLGPASGIPGALRISCPCDDAAFARLADTLTRVMADLPRTGA